MRKVLRLLPIMLCLLIALASFSYAAPVGNYFKEVNITNFNCAAAYCQHPVFITLNASLTNGSDLEVWNSAKTANFSYYRQPPGTGYNSWNYTTASGNIYFNLSAGTTKIYLYYNGSVPDGNTFAGTVIGEDFTTQTALNTTKFYTCAACSGTASVSGGRLYITYRQEAVLNPSIFPFASLNNTFVYTSLADCTSTGSCRTIAPRSLPQNMYLDQMSCVNIEGRNSGEAGRRGLYAEPGGFQMLYYVAGNYPEVWKTRIVWASETSGDSNFSEISFTLNNGTILTTDKSLVQTSAEPHGIGMATGEDAYGGYWNFIIITPYMSATPTFTIGEQQPNTPPAPPAGAPIVWISQTPADITSTNVITTNLRIQYNITNSTPTPYLSWKVNNSASDIFAYENGTPITGWQTKTGTNVSGVFNYTVFDNEILPGTYNLNDDYTEPMQHSNLTQNAQTNYALTTLLNVSNASGYGFFEIMANGTGAALMELYYCNSTYNPAAGGNVGSNANCALFGTKTANASYSHTHTAYSSHSVFPFAANITSGKLLGTNVGITPTSYFLIRGVGTGTESVYYVPNTTRVGATKTTANNGNAWANQTYTIDAHLHQFTNSTTIYYQAFANVSGALNNSSITSQLIALADVPPIPPTVLAPDGSILVYGTYNITYTAAQSLGGLPIYYNISLLNPDRSLNKTIIANTSALSYAWNTAGTPQAQYIIEVKAIDNVSNSAAGRSPLFYVGTFNITQVLPADGIVLQGNSTLLSYAVNNQLVAANCTIYLDAVAYDNRIVNNATVSYLATTGTGTHSWYVSCASADTLFTTTSATRTFSMGYVSYAYAANLTNAPANVYASPQAMFYDKNGSLNVLYYTDEPAGTTLWIKTIYLNGTTATYSAVRDRTNGFYAAFRDTNGTLMLTFNASNGAVKLFKPETNGSITNLGATFPFTNVLNNTGYDAYTYAYTAQYETLNLSANSYFFFMVPLTNGTAKFKKFDNNNTIDQVGAQFPNNIAPSWQTMANNSALTGWYYLNTTGTNVQLAYYNGTAVSLVKELDGGYTGAQLNGSLGNFYEYGGEQYVMLSNLTNTTIYDIKDNLTYQITETLSAPSYLFFVDKDTFVFFNTVGAATSAYSCYFATIANCTKFSAAEYGVNMPYDRGAMTTSKRSGTSDVVAKGVISSGDVVRLLYNQYTYDGKYVCYDEMAETRLSFKVGVYTDTSANVLSNSSWGYVIPSSILGTGNKKAYFTCANGTQRLFIAGLNSNYTINSYSLQQPKGIYYTFQALDQYSIPISNATLTAYRFSVANQAFVPIEQGITDFNGNAVFYLEPYQFYKFLVSANGYVVLTFDLTPGADTILEFKLSQTGGTILTIPTYDRVFNDVSYLLAPANTFQNASFNITYTISSANSTLEYYTMDITREFNGTATLVFNSTGTAAGGGILRYNATQNGTYRVNIRFKAQGYALYQPPQVNYFLSVKQGLSLVKDRLPGMMGGWAYFFIATCIAIVVAAYFSRYTIDGAGILGLIVLWFFTVMNPGAVIVGTAACTLGSIGCITIVMATALTSIVVIGALLWKQFG